MQQFLISFIKRFEWVLRAYSILFINVMPNIFWNPVVFMFGQIRNSYKKSFFARTTSKLAKFTPFASIHIPSKRELLIISANFLPFSRLYTYILFGTAHERGGCDQSIGSSVSDAIVRIWLWSTVARSYSLGYFRKLLQVFDNWPHILW